MESKIKALREEAAKAVNELSKSLNDLNDVRVKYLGKKGELTSLLRGLGQISAEDRPRIGQIVNDARGGPSGSGPRRCRGRVRADRKSVV